MFALTRSQVDKQLESGEYFLSEQQKKQTARDAKYSANAERKAKRVHEHTQLFQPPAVLLTAAARTASRSLQHACNMPRRIDPVR